MGIVLMTILMDQKNCHVMLILMISPYHLTQKGLGQKRRFLMVFHQSHKNSDMEPGE